MYFLLYAISYSVLAHVEKKSLSLLRAYISKVLL